MTARLIDLNADLGEGFGPWRLTDDDRLLSIVTSANVACGFHAGDAATMRTVCERAVAHGVRIGAHVSYRDLAGFGRRAMDVPPDELAAEVAYQIGALQAFATAAGARVAYVKPHGALYHRAGYDPEQAAAVVEGVLLVSGGRQVRTGAQTQACALHPPMSSHAPHAPESMPKPQPQPQRRAPVTAAQSGAPHRVPDRHPPPAFAARPCPASAAAPSGSSTPPLAVLGPPGSRLLQAAAAAGLPAVAEAFADRAYTRAGRLVPRGQDGAVLTDPQTVVERSVRLARFGTVTSRCGQDIAVRARSLCLHGDTPGAVHLARQVRAHLARAGVRVAAFA